MNEFFQKIIPVIMIFFLGVLLKKLKVLHDSDSDLFLRLVFYVCLPALTIISTQKIILSWKHVYIPFIPVIIIMTTYFIALLISRKIKLSRETRGTFLVGSMIMNTAFVFPFILSAFGEKGFAFATIYQFGTGILIFTFVYYIAMRYSPANREGIKIRKFLLLPPIWALIAGIIINLTGFNLPHMLENFFELLSLPTIPLVMLSLGVYFKPKMKNSSRMLLVFSVRIFGGFLISLLLTSILNITGMIRTIIIICSSAPVGYNTLVFSLLEELDKEFAANLVSISLLLGMIYIPALIYFMG